MLDVQMSEAEEVVANRGVAATHALAPSSGSATASTEARRPLGAFVRLVVAGSVGLAAQRVNLGMINLGRDERELAVELEHHLHTRLDDLTVEQRILWGALVLYAIARRLDTGALPEFLLEGIPSSLLSFIESGVAFWDRKSVVGAGDAFTRASALLRARAHVDGAQKHWELEATRAPRVLGRERVKIRVVVDDPSDDLVLPIAFRVPGRDDIRVELEDAPGATLTDDAVRIAISDEWTDVLFRLVGERTEQVRLEAFVVGTADEPVLVDGLFSVGGDGRTQQRESATLAAASNGMRAAEGSPVDRVFEHLRVHGYITESEAVELLGSPRALRAFSLAFEAHAAKVPFSVHVEVTGEGKRYVRGD